MENNDKKVLLDKIQKSLAQVRPYLQNDGGDITFVELTDDNTLKVKLEGACKGCPFSMQTLKAGVEMSIKKEIPEIKEVIAIE